MEEKLKTSPGREARFKRLEEDKVWDVVVIGGGATGSGIALDAAARGFSVLLLDAQDFSAGTSSRSSKLIHSGLRSLKDPRGWKLAREAMIERKLLLGNAPDLVRPQAFILPCYKDFERVCYMGGLSLYSAMAGAGGRVGPTQFLSAAETIRRIPGVKPQGLKGGVQFSEAQFDDARLNIALLRTAEARGATALNYAPVTSFGRGKDGSVRAVLVKDKVSGRDYEVKTRMVFNAAGVWADEIRRMVNPEARSLIRVSRGSHIVVNTDRFESKRGMFIPKTPDGRALFFVPWNGVLEIGMTEVQGADITFAPKVTEAEIDFLRETASAYLEYPLQKKDVLASFAGLRAVANPAAGGCAVTPEFNNMITVTGGNWTLYRRTAEQAMTAAVDQGLIYKRPCPTKYMSICRDEHFDAETMDEAACKGTLDEEKLVAFARHCIDNAYAVTAEDVLYRRLRVGQMNEKRAQELLAKIEPLFE